MKTIRKPFFCFSLFSVFLCGGAVQAAEEAGASLMEVTGTVLVNQGKNYQPGQSGMKLPLNARVLTKDNASAVVSSKQGCITRLGANSLYVVRAADPCHGGPTAQKLEPAPRAPMASADAGGGGAKAAAAGGSPGAGTGAGTYGSAGAGWLDSQTNQIVLGVAGAAAVAGGIAGGLSGGGGGSSGSNPAAVSASNAVLATGGSAQAAYAAAATVAAGGDAAAVRAAVLAAGGSVVSANAAAAAYGAAVAGGDPGQINNAINTATNATCNAISPAQPPTGCPQ